MGIEAVLILLCDAKNIHFTMKSKKNRCQFLLLSTIFVLFHSSLPAQTAVEIPRIATQVGVEGNLSKVEGDAPAFVRQDANDYSTNFGTQATYARRWAPGIGLYGISTINIFNFLGLDIGYRLGSITAKEEYEVTYTPANNLGISHSLNVLSNRMYNFTPSVGIRGRWKGISIIAGAEANFFMTGRTQTLASYTGTISGETSTVEETRIDTQDQPVYLDPLHFGGIVDYTSITNRNHGANAIWVAGFASGEYTVLDRRHSPVIGFTYRLPFMEIIRSQNPYWSLIHGVDAKFESMNLGTKVSTISFRIGLTL
jgi:hypothetical protein